MFWKAMSLNRSFLHSTLCGVMFWYPLGTHLSRRYPSWFSVQFLTGFWSVLEHCGSKLCPWGDPKWSDDKDIQGKRHFWAILGALKFSARSDKMSWRNLKKSNGGRTSKFGPHLRWYAAQHFKGRAHVVLHGRRQNPENLSQQDFPLNTDNRMV